MPNLIQRQQHQQHRINVGVARGRLTAEEAQASREALKAAHQQIRADREDGGRLTRREWRQDQLLLNQSSQAIRQARRSEAQLP